MIRFKSRNLNQETWAGIILSGQSYVVTGLGVVAAVITARALNPEDRGVLAILVLIPQFLSRVVSVGFEQIILRNHNELKANNILISELISASLLLIFFATPALFLLVVGLNLDYTLSFFFVVSAILVCLIRFFTSSFISQRQLKLVSLLGISQAGLQVILYMICAKFFYSPNYFFAAWILVLFVTMSFSIFLSRFNSFVFSAKYVRSNVNQGMKYLSIVIPEISFGFGLEMLIIKFVLGSSDVGNYAIAKTISALYFQIFINFSALKLKRFSSELKSIEIFLFLIIGIAIYMLSQPVINLVFGTSYGKAHGFLIWTIFTAFFVGISRFYVDVSSNSKTNYFTLVVFTLAFLPSLLFGGVTKELCVPLITFGYVAYSVFIIKNRK
jgi:O-antigen/teichoic acid export membrane protein